jgi:hypothetical protein
MASETDKPFRSDTRKHVLFDPGGQARDPLAAERVALSPEQRGEDDRLEPPGVRAAVVAFAGAGVIAFLAVALTGLFLYFHAQVGAQPHVAVARFPDPRLETNIDPRSLPAVQPGGAQVHPPVVPAPSWALLKAAMALVLARGAHAYDPLLDPHAPGPAPHRAQATPAPPTAPGEDGR